MRRIWLDNLRWVIILLVVLHHLVCFFNSAGVPMNVNAPGIPALDAIAYFCYPWFMPCMFLLAGISARYALEEQSTGRFLAARVRKLLIPFAAGVVLLGIPLVSFAFAVKGGSVGEMIAYFPSPAIALFFLALMGMGPQWFLLALFLVTLLLLPFGGYLVKIAMRILPDRKEDKEEGMHLAFLVPMPASKQEHPIGFSAMYVTQIRQELNRMMGMAKENIATSFQAVLERDVKRVESAEATEEYIDYLNKEISQYISNIIVHETNEKDSTAISAYFKITGNIERIGDHAMNICEYTQMLDKKKIQFSEEAQEELRTMEAVCLEVLDLLEQESIEPTDWLTKVSALEQRMDDMTEEYRRNQMKRMKQGSCSDEACIIFSELLTDFERIGDHALNIAQERAGIATEATDA